MEEICTLCDYLILARPMGDRVWQLFSMAESKLKSAISEFASWGY